MDSQVNSNADVKNLWLAEFVVASDILIMEIVERYVGKQEAVGKIQHCYTSIYKEIGKYDSGVLQFVTGTASWGNSTPEKGETVLIAISHLPFENSELGRMYEQHWHGHFAVQKLDGQLCAVAKYEISKNPRVPQAIRNAVLTVPGAPMFSAFPFAMLEDYLMELIPKINNVEPVRSQLSNTGFLSV